MDLFRRKKAEDRLVGRVNQIVEHHRNLLNERLDEMRGRLDEIAFSANKAKNSASLFMGHGVALTTLYNGAPIYVDTSDVSVTPHLLLHGLWEPEIGAVWLEEVMAKPDPVIFDVGANTGYFGILANTTNRNARVHYFEPNPRLVDLIRKSTAANGLLGSSFLVQQAVAATSGKPLKLVIPGGYLGGASVRDNLREVFEKSSDFSSVDEVEVLSASMDDYCEKNNVWPDLLKIDVEGFEYEVFKGASNLLKRKKDMKIFLEYFPNFYPPEFRDLIDKHFSVKCRITDSKAVVFKDWSEVEALKDWSMLVLGN